MKSNIFDIAVVGAGLVGSIQALLLAQAGYDIVLLDSAPEVQNKFLDGNNIINQDLKPDLRMSAITLRSEEILDQIGVWDLVKQRSGLIKKTHILVEHGASKLSFDSLSIGKNHTGSIIENNLLQEALKNKITNFVGINGSIKLIKPCKISEIIEINNKINIITSCGEYLANLIIGADGANSFLRNYLKFNCVVQDYNHAALVTNVYTEKSHASTAYQIFLDSDVIAFLPWQDPHCCSIVWSQNITDAMFYSNCSEQEFIEKIERYYKPYFGKILKIDERAYFSLTMRHSQQYYKNKCFLIGDAAHTIHPLAGQGLNLGIYDADELAKILKECKSYNLGLNLVAIANKYELRRRGHNQQMINLMSMFKNIYSSNNKSFNCIRNSGMKLINNLDFIKKKITRNAAGFD